MLLWFANRAGFGVVFTVIDDLGETEESSIDVIRYNEFYRITSNYNSTGNVYIAFPKGSIFTSDCVFKIRCDAINTLTNVYTDSAKFFYSSVRGDSKLGAMDTISGTEDYYSLGNKGIRFSLNDGATYNDGDRFRVYGKAVWPVKSLIESPFDFGTIRIGESSEVRAFRFKLESGFELMYEKAGFAAFEWSYDPVGDTTFNYALSSKWPSKLLSIDDFDESCTNVTTTDWFSIISGTNVSIFKDSNEFNTNGFMSDMIFCYINLDDNQEGMNNITTRFYYEV